MRLTVNGQALDLEEGTSINFTINNSLFGKDLIPGSYSLSFDLPATPTNKLALGFPATIDRFADLPVDVPCTVRDGIYEIVGKLSIDDADNENIKANIFTAAGAVNELLNDTSIRDIALEVIDNKGSSYLMLYFDKDQNFNLPAVGTQLKFVIHRQDSQDHDVVVYLLWNGSYHELLDQIVDKLNNRPLPTVHVPGQVYHLGDIALDGNGDVFESTINNNTSLLSNTNDWMGPLVASTPGFQSFYTENSSPYLYRYSDPHPEAAFLSARIEQAGLLNPSERVVVITDRLPVADYDRNRRLDYLLIANNNKWQGLQTNLDATTIDTHTDRLLLDTLDQIVTKDYPDANYTCFPVKNEFDVQAWNPSFPNHVYMNYHTPDGFEIPDLQAPNRFWYCLYPYLLYVLHKSFEYAGIELDSSEVEDDLKRVVLYSNEVIQTVGVNSTLDPRLRFHREIPLSESLPDTSIADLIKAVREFFFVGFVFSIDGSRCKLVWPQDIVQSTKAVDFSSVASPQYSIDEDRPTGFIIKYKLDGSDKLLKERIADLSQFGEGQPVALVADLPDTEVNLRELVFVIVEDQYYKPTYNSETGVYIWEPAGISLHDLVVVREDETRDTGVSPGLMITESDSQAANFNITARNWKIPTINQDITFRLISHINNPELRFLQYFGLQPDSNGDMYPYASFDNTDYAGNVLGSLSMRLDKPEGTYENFGKPWLNFLLRTRNISQSLALNKLQLYNLKQTDPIEIDGLSFMWEQMSFSLPLREPVQFTLKLIR